MEKGDQEYLPSRPKHPCAYPGCPRLTSGQYCEEHARTECRRYDKYERSKDVHRRYGRAWTRVRNRYMQEHPYCERCLGEGRMTLAEECHHILPVSKGGANVPENLMALCPSCHNKVHHEMGDR